jgi:protein-S-isoprenylcysteine O-methyltransferase Ste14
MNKQKFRESKKALAVGIALLNINVLFVFSVFHQTDTQIMVQMITAILFLVGIYTGVQGGIDMVQSNKIDVTKSDTTETKIVKKYEYKMDYAE